MLICVTVAVHGMEDREPQLHSGLKYYLLIVSSHVTSPFRQTLQAARWRIHINMPPGPGAMFCA